MMTAARTMQWFLQCFLGLMMMAVAWRLVGAVGAMFAEERDHKDTCHVKWGERSDQRGLHRLVTRSNGSGIDLPQQRGRPNGLP